MLREASIELARSSGSLTSVARTQQSLAELDAEISLLTPHWRLPLDWRDQHAFLEGISLHLRRVEPPDLVVAWIHDDPLTIELARTLSPARCIFYHVISTANASPMRIAEKHAPAGRNSGVDYRQIILGHVADNGGRRWLTNSEISHGVIQAIRQANLQRVVGVVDE